MRTAGRKGEVRTWFAAHREFHQTMYTAVGEGLQRQLAAYADRSIRYIRIHRLAEPISRQTAGEAEHQAIFDAVVARDRPAALTGLAHHLARTAERVLSECVPAYRIQAVTHALALVDQLVLAGT